LIIHEDICSPIAVEEYAKRDLLKREKLWQYASDEPALRFAREVVSRSLREAANILG
jgi:hypothetical protein